MGALRRIKTKRRTRYVYTLLGCVSYNRVGDVLTSHRDYDQVLRDIDSPRHLEIFKETKDAEDLPGLGKHYCLECAKWFESDYNLKAHTKGKNHKKR
jgi:bud site selection protein 20